MRRFSRWWLGGAMWLAACGATPNDSATAGDPVVPADSDLRRSEGPAQSEPGSAGARGPGEGGSYPSPPPPEPRTAAARERFVEAVRLYDAGDYNRALLQFRAAYELVPRGAILFNIAQCQERLGDLQGALGTYQHFLRASDEQLPEHQRRAAFERVRELERQLGSH